MVMLARVNCKKKKKKLLNVKMRKSSVSTLITQNHIHSNLNSILNFQNGIKNARD